jgi:hypothetical protein
MDTIKGFLFGLIFGGMVWYFTDWYRFHLFVTGG